MPNAVVLLGSSASSATAPPCCSYWAHPSVQLFTLANPLLIQVIIDKVIAQRSLDTLQVRESHWWP